MCYSWPVLMCRYCKVGVAAEPECLVFVLIEVVRGKIHAILLGLWPRVQQ